MLQYTLRRLVLGMLTALLVSIIVFVILRIAPGDVVDVILGGEDAFYSQETEELLREQLGLNRPLYVQYFVFMRDFVTLDWGTSLVDSKPIWPQIKKKLPITLQLSLMTVGPCRGVWDSCGSYHGAEARLLDRTTCCVSSPLEACPSQASGRGQ